MLTWLVRLSQQKTPLILIFYASLIWTSVTTERTNSRRSKKATEIGESLKSLELRQCFEERRLITGFSSPNLIAEPTFDQQKWCLRAFTDRNATDMKNVIGSSWVEFSWYRLDHHDSKNERSVPVPCVHGTDSLDGVAASVPRCRDARPSCTVAYDGFRGEYRLSPDFGGYMKCSPTIEQYFFKLHNRTTSDKQRPSLSPGPSSRQRYDAPSKRGCPLKRLPFSQEDFETCTLSSNAWYLLTFRSYARWESSNGSFIEAIGNEGSQLLRTYERRDEMYMNHTQVTGCLLKTIFLLRHKLPFLLRIKVDVHVKNDANAVKQVHQEDRHDVGTDLVGKEFTYQLPPGSRLVRYCQKAEAILDRDPDFVMPLPNEVHSCVARAVPNCPPEVANASALLHTLSFMDAVFVAISILVRTIIH